MIYFDNAATTPVCDVSAKAMLDAVTNVWGNPSSTHSSGRKSKAMMEQARRVFAKDLNAAPSEIMFTSGATESIMLGMYSACMEGVSQIITAASEHKAVLDISKQLSNQFSIPSRVIGVDSNGNVSLDELEELLKDSTGKTLIAIMYVNNETGVVHPVEAIGSLAKSYDALFFCDCVQAGLYHTIDPKAQGIDYLSLSAHKLYGPKGSGLLYIDKKRDKYAFWAGGSQERGHRPGTENLPGILGFAAAWQASQDNKMNYFSHIETLNKELKSKLRSRLPDVSFNGNDTSPHICNVTIPTTKTPAAVLLQLDISGISLSAGSACQSGSHSRSHVLEAMNLPNNGVDLRISLGRQNTIGEINQLIDVLGAVLS